jgi:carbon monoxide dehydrogenase subunit G
MIPIRGSVEIQRPAEDVFEFLSDLGNAPKWQRGVAESRRTSEGPIRVGTRFRETVRTMGMRFEAMCEVTVFDPPRKFSMTADGKMIHYEGDFTFEPIAGGEATRLSVTASMKMKGLWRVLEWIAGREIRKESLAELEDIKKALEAGP